MWKKKITFQVYACSWVLPFKVHFWISVKYLRGFKKKPGVISFGIWNLFQNAKKRDCKCFLVFALCVDVSGFSSRMYLFSKTKKVFKYPCRKKRNDAKYFSLTQMKYKEKDTFSSFAFSYCMSYFAKFWHYFCFFCYKNASKSAFTMYFAYFWLV